VFNVLVASFLQWQHEYKSTTDPELKRQSLRVLRFLSHELKTDFTLSHLAKFSADVEARLASVKESTEQEDRPNDDFTARGVMDL
jgi:ABC-type histidine transport system ATPase subunit